MIIKKEFLKYPLLILSLLMIFFGISNGEMKTVLMKAAAICLECIGIG